MVPEAPEMPITRRRGVLLVIGRSRSFAAIATRRVELCKCRKHGVERSRRKWPDDALIRADAVLGRLGLGRGRPAEAARFREAIQRLLLETLGLKLDRLDPGAKRF